MEKKVFYRSTFCIKRKQGLSQFCFLISKWPCLVVGLMRIVSRRNIQSWVANSLKVAFGNFINWPFVEVQRTYTSASLSLGIVLPLYWLGKPAPLLVSAGSSSNLRRSAELMPKDNLIPAPYLSQPHPTLPCSCVLLLRAKIGGQEEVRLKRPGWDSWQTWEGGPFSGRKDHVGGTPRCVVVWIGFSANPTEKWPVTHRHTRLSWGECGGSKMEKMERMLAQKGHDEMWPL